MEITLYKDCILNKSYSEVFRNTTYLENYITNSLTKVTINIKPVNIHKSGQIVLDMSSLTTERDRFLYNYMKIYVNSNIIIYAFIDKIYTRNNNLVILYDTDVWHTYLGEWTFRKGLLTNCLRTSNYSQIHGIDFPCRIESNIEVDKYKLGYVELSARNKVSILLEIQTYKLESADSKESDVELYVGLYKQANITMDFTFSQLFDEIKAIINNQLKGGFKGENNRYYRVLNVYLINYCFGIPATLDSGTSVDLFVKGNITRQLVIFKNAEGPIIVVNQQRALGSITIPNDYTNVSFGFMTDRFVTYNNGLDMHINIKILSTGDKIKFYLYYNDVQVEITEDFRYDIPYNVITADNFEQRRIANELQNSLLTTSSVRNSVKIGTSALSLGISTANIISDAVSNSFLSSMGLPPIEMSSDELGKTINQMGSDVNSITSGITNLIDNSNKRKAINSEMYSNTYTNNYQQNSYINQLYGLVLFKFNTSDDYSNYQECLTILNEVGYNVNAIVPGIASSITGGSYDVIKFDYVLISGLSTELNNIIRNILLNGVKIWYSSSPS